MKWKGKTLSYLLHRLFPGASESQLDGILWGLTCYPFSPRCIQDLYKVRRRIKPWNKGWTKRLEAEHKRQDEEMTLAMRRYRVQA